MFLNQSIFTPGCIQCGSLLVEESLFCSYCFKKFIKPRIENSYHYELNSQNNLRHIFLMEWNKGEDLLMGQLVYRLKADQSPQAIEFYSDLLAEKLIEAVDVTTYSAFIPVPGSSSKRVHAALIAKRLSLMTGLKNISVLDKQTDVLQQKKLSSAERKRHNPFRLKSMVPEEFTGGFQGCGPFVFVDDVLTTGQSIKHAENIINNGKPNAVATLFYRPQQ